MWLHCDLSWAKYYSVFSLMTLLMKKQSQFAEFVSHASQPFERKDESSKQLWYTTVVISKYIKRHSRQTKARAVAQYVAQICKLHKYETINDLLDGCFVERRNAVLQWITGYKRVGSAVLFWKNRWEHINRCDSCEITTLPFQPTQQEWD